MEGQRQDQATPAPPAGNVYTVVGLSDDYVKSVYDGTAPAETVVMGPGKPPRP